MTKEQQKRGKKHTDRNDVPVARQDRATSLAGLQQDVPSRRSAKGARVSGTDLHRAASSRGPAAGSASITGSQQRAASVAAHVRL